MAHKFLFDLIVVGGGSGGQRAAKEAADIGAKVALLDYVKPSTQGSSWGLGGTCVNVGCIPKKQMHYAAITAEKIFNQSYSYGWNILPEHIIDEETNPYHHIEPKERSQYFDWKRIVTGVLNTRKGSNFVYKNELRNRNITYYNALGRLVDTHTVEVNYPNEQQKNVQITGNYIVIAPGGRPHVPEDVPGAIEHAITSDDIFGLKKAPGKTLVIGGAYIALETAGFLTAFGYDTTVAVRSVILRSDAFDKEVATILQGRLQSTRGFKFLQPAVPTKIEKLENGKKRVYIKNLTSGEVTSDDYDTVFFATGRAADTKGLNLDAVGVKYTKEGKIIVNDIEQTSVPNIFALGDIIENGYNFELTPVAIQQGKLLAWRLFGANPTNLQYATERKVNPAKKVEYHFVPSTVFTPIEYGVVGYSEEAAIKKFGKQNLIVYKKTFNILENKIPDVEEKGFVKLVCLKEAKQEKVIGLHYLGPEAAEVVQGYALALKKGVTKEDFDDLIGIHPSNAESFVYLQENVFEDATCCG